MTPRSPEVDKREVDQREVDKRVRFSEDPPQVREFALEEGRALARACARRCTLPGARTAKPPIHRGGRRRVIIRQIVQRAR